MKKRLYPLFPILMVDDEPHILIGFDTLLRANGMTHLISCKDSREVLPIFSEQEISVLLLDLYMPHLSGETLLSEVTQHFPEVPVVVITGADDVDIAVRCIKSGAFDYLVKPVDEERLLTHVKQAIEFRELHRENALLKAHILSDTLKYPEVFSEIITRSESMRAIFQYAEAIAHSPMPVLITGETGVGKELLAKAVHVLSGCKGELVKVNVAGLDDNIFTDTLFGHRKGAFTGADSARGGLIERASGGTLFLDEIGDLSIASQIKLLRLLQDREYYPLGQDQPVYANTRIIVATNQDIEKLKQRDTFRKDLYFRLQTHHIHIPPLRKRKEDIPMLTAYFLKKASQTLKRRTPTAPEELYTLLVTYHFPGNIRELQSLIFDAVSRHQSKKLSLSVFKAYISQRNRMPDEFLEIKTDKVTLFSHCQRLPTLKAAEACLINEALKRSQGNQSIAAQLLGISRQALNRRLRHRNKK